MSLDNLSQFIHAIDRAGELARIKEPVKARLELCEIADRVMKQPSGGKALLFESVILDSGRQSEFPVAINLFGSMRRMSLALGVENLDQVGARITELLDLKVPEGLLGKLSMLPKLLEVGQFQFSSADVERRRKVLQYYYPNEKNINAEDLGLMHLTDSPKDAVDFIIKTCTQSKR